MKTEKEIEKLAGDYADDHSFRVPFDGTNNFYDDKDFKWSKEGFIAGYKAALQNKVSDISAEDMEILKKIRNYFGENSAPIFHHTSFAVIDKIIKNGSVNESKDSSWISVEKDLPPTGTMVDGYNKSWIDEDFNPEGIRECFLHDEGFWNNAVWNNDQDCWDTFDSTPTHWKRRFPPQPKQGSNYKEYQIDFGGHLQARISLLNGVIKVIRAIDGYGDGVPMNEIGIIESPKQKED